jgi:hypothetical protein
MNLFRMSVLNCLSLGLGLVMLSLSSAIPILANLHAGRADIVKGSRVPVGELHDVIFSIRPRNLDILAELVTDVSTLTSLNYGNHLSREELSQLTSNPEGAAHLRTFLAQHHPDAVVVKWSRDSRHITVRGPIGLWESMLNAEFHSFFRKSHDGQKFDLEFKRALQYEIPTGLAEHVVSVLNTVQMPSRSKSSQVHRRNSNFGVSSSGYVTPSLINTFCE